MNCIKKVTERFSKSGFDVSLINAKCDSLSISFVNINGNRNNFCMLDKSTIFYYIIDGEGIFEINNEKINVKKNDLLEIPPKNKYSYEGNLYMLEIMSQAFDESEVHEFPKGVF